MEASMPRASKGKLKSDVVPAVGIVGLSLSMTGGASAAAASHLAVSPSTASGELPGLTARERQVLTLVAQGLSNRQIADQLFISTKTASVHVSNILRKLGATSRTEAVFMAQPGRAVA